MPKTTPTTPTTTSANEPAPKEPALSLSNGPGGKFYLRSKTVIGALVAAVPQLLRIFGVELDDADGSPELAERAQLVGDSALTALGAILIFWGRLTATQPLRFRSTSVSAGLENQLPENHEEFKRAYGPHRRAPRGEEAELPQSDARFPEALAAEFSEHRLTGFGFRVDRPASANETIPHRPDENVGVSL